MDGFTPLIITIFNDNFYSTFYYLIYRIADILHFPFEFRTC